MMKMPSGIRKITYNHIGVINFAQKNLSIEAKKDHTLNSFKKPGYFLQVLSSGQ